METIPNFPFISSLAKGIRSSGGERTCLKFANPLAGLLTTLLLSACSLQPVPPLSLDDDAQSLPASVETFDTETRPAPGRFRFLDKVENAVVEQLQALGYNYVEEGGDISVLIQLARTDSIIPFMEPVESGRLTLYLSAGDKTLRVGRTPNLNSIDLDFMQDEEIAQRVSLFLEGIPARRHSGRNNASP